MAKSGEQKNTRSSSRRSAKSPEAFRTISEVASELEVPQHVLRFWESKFSQVSPLKRGGGRRYYRPKDVQLLHKIRSLLYTEGYTIKGVQKVLRQSSKKASIANGASSSKPSKKIATEDPGYADALRVVLKELSELKSILDKR